MHHRYPPGVFQSAFLFFLLFGFFSQAWTQGAGRALTFDGVDEYVTMDPSTGLNVTGDMTIEFWIFMTSSDVPAIGDSAFVLAFGANGDTEADNVLYAVYVRPENGDYNVGYFHEYSTGTDDKAIITGKVKAGAAGKWHHVAIVRSGTNLIIYVDGLQERNKTFTQSPTGGGNGTFVLGGGFNDAGTSGNKVPSVHFFKGTLDEVRIWNTARSQADIKQNMNQKLSGTESNLIGYWRLDETTGTILTDATGTNNGNMVNMENGDHSISTAPIGDNSLFQETVPNDAGPFSITETADVQADVDLEFTDPLNLPASSFLFSVMQVNQNPNFTGGLLLNYSPLYWELWSPTPSFSGDPFQATIKVHYDNLQNNIAVESDLKLYTRADAATTTWSEVTGAVVVSNDGGTSSNTDGIGYIEFTITDADPDGYSGQYILTSDNPDNSLPVQLALFQATVQAGGILLEWTTYSEVNNLGFEVWRAVGEPSGFEMLDSYQTNPDLQGAGNSSTTNYYQYLDRDVQPGQTYYYQLYDVSYDGEKEASSILAVTVGDLNYLTANRIELHQNYPNPFNPSTQISFEIFRRDGSAQLTTLDIFDAMGRKVRRLVEGYLLPGSYHYLWDGRNEFGLSVSSGTYFYLLKVGNTVSTRKMQLIK